MKARVRKLFARRAVAASSRLALLGRPVERIVPTPSGGFAVRWAGRPPVDPCGRCQLAVAGLAFSLSPGFLRLTNPTPNI